MRERVWIGAVLVLAAVACGGDEPAEETMVEEEPTAGAEEEAPREEEGVAIEGLMGTISEMAVQRGMEPRMGRFMRCFMERYGSVEVLGGHIDMAFRIRRDGSVLWVYPRESTIGDRETERCLLEQAGSIRFSRPQGGEAEFNYPLDLDAPEDVRPPVPWDASRVASAVERQRGEIVDCGTGPFTVTAYVSPGGAVLAAGASTTDPAQADALDCVAELVKGWEMPDPGSYPAKVTFQL